MVGCGFSISPLCETSRCICDPSHFVYCCVGQGNLSSLSNVEVYKLYFNNHILKCQQVNQFWPGNCLIHDVHLTVNLILSGRVECRLLGLYFHIKFSSTKDVL